MNLNVKKKLLTIPNEYPLGQFFVQTVELTIFRDLVLFE